MDRMYRIKISDLKFQILNCLSSCQSCPSMLIALSNSSFTRSRPRAATNSGQLLLQLPPQPLRRADLGLALADRGDDLLGEHRVEGRPVDEASADATARAVADASGRRVEAREEGLAV